MGALRIGLVAPPWVPVPPPAYGGTEVVVDNLARGLADLGHSVRLFTVGESTCPVERDFLYDAVPPDPMGSSVAEAAHVLAAYESLRDEVDVVHDHTALGPLVAGRTGLCHVPVVATHHGPFSPENLRIVGEAARTASIVAISHSQARFARHVPIAAVIHHGIDLEQYTPGPGGGGYLLFVGRMSYDKGVHRAIRVARATGRRLVIASKVREKSEHDYFEGEVRPLLGPDTELLVEPPVDVRMDLLHHADALLNPISWPEPFGLVMAESLACGTPVIAYPCGAAPEIVEHGRTGFLCRDEDEMLAAVLRVDELDRAACRASAQERFSLQRMARDHDHLYARVLERPVGRRAAPIPFGRRGGPASLPGGHGGLASSGRG